MTSPVRAMTPVLYTRSLTVATGFYGLLGFEPVLAGDDGEWAWWYGRCGEVGLLMAEDGQVEKQRGPVQLYLQTDDLAVVQQRLAEGGITPEHLGHPDHAPGGEIRTIDPDGRVVMVAQTTGTRPAGESAGDSTGILQQAAEALRRRGGAAHECQIPGIDGETCPRRAEVKMADGWGESAWTCLPHADEVLFTVRSAFVATEDAEGLGRFLVRRRAAGTSPR